MNRRAILSLSLRDAGPADSVTDPAGVTASALQLHPAAEVFVDSEAADSLRLLDHYRWMQKTKPGAAALR